MPDPLVWFKHVSVNQFRLQNDSLIARRKTPTDLYEIPYIKHLSHKVNIAYKRSFVNSLFFSIMGYAGGALSLYGLDGGRGAMKECKHSCST